MTKDLTRGRPMGLLLGFGIPVLLGYLFQQLYSVIDTAIVGKILGGAALAAAPIITVFLIFQKKFVQGIATSGLKG